MSVDVVTFGCRLNLHEFGWIRHHAEAAGLSGRRRRQYLRSD